MCKRGLFLLLRGKEENMKNVSEELWLFIINLLLQLKYQSTQLLWSWYFPLEGSFVEVWLSAAGAESFICSTVKSINTHSNHSVAQCYSPRWLHDWASEQTQRCDRLCWRGGCSLCRDNYMYQGWLPVGEAFTFTSNMCVWKLYRRMPCT